MKTRLLCFIPILLLLCAVSVFAEEKETDKDTGLIIAPGPGSLKIINK